MTDVTDLFEYNDWAHRRLLAVTDQLTQEQLDAPMPDLGGSVLGLLNHLAQVEAVFHAVLSGRPRPAPHERTYTEVKTALAENAEAYRLALPDFLERREHTFEMAWFGRTFTVEQALLQVATHGIQHRAGVAAGIARAGLEAPNLDYIIWLNEFR